MNKCLLGLLAFLLAAQCSWAADDLQLKDQNDRINYSIGYQIGGDFVRQGLTLNAEAIVRGIRDAIEAKQTLLTPQEMNETLVALKEQIIAEQRKQTSEAGAAFLAENLKRAGVVALKSGSQYRVLQAGTGAKPTAHDSVNIHYRTLSIDGRELSNTYGESQPRNYQIEKMAPGFQEIMLLMKEGSKWEVALPVSQEAGKDQTSAEKGVLVYEIELVSVDPAPKQ